MNVRQCCKALALSGHWSFYHHHCPPPPEPTGVRDLVVYPLSPTVVILSWQRPYHVAFRKYVLQTFFFNPVTLASEWTTYYEIAATASVIASVVRVRPGR